MREAIADNKSKTAELEKLKTAHEILLTERDLLAEKLAKAKEEKDKAVQAKNERYLAELPELRTIHRAELKKEVDDAKDWGYAEGESVYGRQVASAKDIFFQCVWKMAAEKLGQALESELFNNPPPAFIPSYMQAYAAVVQ